MTAELIINIGLILLFIGGFILLPQKRTAKKFGLCAVILCLVFEIFVCNFHSFHLWFRDYEERELSFENAGIDRSSVENVTQARLVFPNIDQTVGTVYIDVTLHEAAYSEDFEKVIKQTDKVDVKIDAKDETYAASYRNTVADGLIVRGDEQSNVIVMNMSGKVSDMRITLTSDADSLFTVNGITVNRAVPLNISAFRFILFFAIIFGMYTLINSRRLNSSIDQNGKLYAYISVGITVIFLFFAFLITVLYNYNGGGYLFNDLKQTSGNQISQELVDAFEAGQAELLEKPGEHILSMKNPYDWGERINAGIGYKWDHLLYEGKYYSYYGIAPVILLFLPYHLLTGYYFPTPEAVLIFGMIGIAFLTLLFYEFSKKLFPKLPLNIAVTSLIILQASSSVWYCFASPLFYEIAQSSGFAFTCAGFYFLLKSNVITEGRIFKRHLVLSSFCLSCAVLCRPTLAVYCIAALLFIAAGFIKNKKEAEEKGQRPIKASFIYLTSALACFVVIGSVQMIYNYVRFDSFFDFGIQYSLTINDFTKAQYHTDFVTIGFWNFLFAAPYMKPEFPFVFSNFSTLDTNGYYFIANTNAIGVFYRAFPALGLFLSPLAFKVADKKKRLFPSLLLAAVCMICPLVIIFSIWESGYGVRYAADFYWQMILGGMAVIYYLFQKFDLYKNRFAKGFITVFFVYSAIVSFYFNFALMYDYIGKTGYLTDEFLRFSRLFEFWV